MATIALTDTEKNSLITDTTFNDYLKQRVLAKAANFKGLNSGDLIWAKGRAWSALIENSPNLLFGDNGLANLFILKMLVRAFANKDDTEIGLGNQVIAYLNASSRIDFLVDDYFEQKGKEIPM
jgi:hypothetical protein